MSRICSVSAFCWPLISHSGPDWLLTAQNRIRTPFFGLRDTPVSTQNLSLFTFTMCLTVCRDFGFQFFGFCGRFGFLWLFLVLLLLVFFSSSVSSWQALAGPGRPWQATAGPGRLRQALAAGFKNFLPRNILESFL